MKCDEIIIEKEYNIFIKSTNFYKFIYIYILIPIALPASNLKEVDSTSKLHMKRYRQLMTQMNFAKLMQNFTTFLFSIMKYLDLSAQIQEFSKTDHFHIMEAELKTKPSGIDQVNIDFVALH